MSAAPNGTTATAAQQPVNAGTVGSPNGLNEVQAKKVDKLDEADLKRQEKEQSKAVKSAQSDEKAVRKAKKAEEKSIKVRYPQMMLQAPLLTRHHPSLPSFTAPAKGSV